MSSLILPVILAGGSGTRLWPLSRTAHPKQFLSLHSSLSMLQETTARLDGLAQTAPMVICNEEHRFLVAEQLRSSGSGQASDKSSDHTSIILEPVGRNTAPAIALAAMQALVNVDSSGADGSKPEEQPVLLVLAADHLIEDVAAFQAAVKLLLPAVQQGKFGTLGIVPTEPATGYGYIKSSPLCEEQLLAVEQFVEKPDEETAKSYLAENAGGNKWLWNSGMFLIRADRYLAALKNYRNDIFTACEKAMAATKQDMDFIRIDAAAFAACPDESIDYAVMEPLASLNESGPSVVVAPLDAGWSDVGSWSALWEIADKDEQGNALLGYDASCDTDGNTSKTADVILQDTTNSFIYGQDRLITTLGVDNLVIVDTPDALLVANKDNVQDIKKIVSKIKDSSRNEHHSHREVYRPWGKYDCIDSSEKNSGGSRYQVKRITVNPGAKMSLQMHRQRAEHWVVVSGTAKVTSGETLSTRKTFLVTENESTFIPIGHVHSLENPGVIPLEMIEVQSGSYLGEDDIVRFEDKYGRI